MLHSEAINELAAALAAAQGEVKPAALDGKNPHFGSKYATLAALWTVVRAAFPKHGLSIVQGASDTGAIDTTILHTSGQWVTLAGLPMKATKDDPQGIGSLLTYARRYGLAAAAGLVADDDDDANAATGKPAPAKAAEKTTEKPAAKPGSDEVIEMEVTPEPVAGNLNDENFELELPVAPAIMVGDEIVVEGSNISQDKVETVICRCLGIDAPEPEKKGILRRLFGR